MGEEFKTLLEDQLKAFEEFKSANDEVLQAKAEGKAVAELESKVNKANDEITRLNNEIADLAKKANRPEALGDAKDVLNNEHKEAFLGFMRKGQDAGLAEIQLKAVNVGVDGDGGYAVPHTLDRSILELLRDESPMRQVCNVITIGGEHYSKPVNLGGASSGWVGETDERPETDGPKLTVIKPVMGEIYANPASTQQALDDMFFSPETWLAQEVAYEFAKQEGLAFLMGDGTNKPKGLLAAPVDTKSDKEGRAFGTIQVLDTGVADNFPVEAPADVLIDLIYSLKGGYRNGAGFMMNSLTLSTIRKWKDKEGNYIWQPSIQMGQPSLILGYGVTENEDMPDIGANALPVLFGNFKRAYSIVDRFGTRVLRDPYTNKPYVHFYTTKRVGGMLEDTQAVKFLRCKAGA